DNMMAFTSLSPGAFFPHGELLLPRVHSTDPVGLLLAMDENLRPVAISTTVRADVSGLGWCRRDEAGGEPCSRITFSRRFSTGRFLRRSSTRTTSAWHFTTSIRRRLSMYFSSPASSFRP